MLPVAVVRDPSAICGHAPRLRAPQGFEDHGVVDHHPSSLVDSRE